MVGQGVQPLFQLMLQSAQTTAMLQLLQITPVVRELQEALP
jgi:hypothetical protein